MFAHCLAPSSWPTALAVSECTIKLISSYDETTDKTVTALQKKTEAHRVALETVAGLPECKYEKHRQFYEEAKIDVSAIAVRAAQPDLRKMPRRPVSPPLGNRSKRDFLDQSNS